MSKITLDKIQSFIIPPKKAYSSKDSIVPSSEFSPSSVYLTVSWPINLQWWAG